MRGKAWLPLIALALSTGVLSAEACKSFTPSEAVAAINEVRAKQRSCGAKVVKPAPPLVWSDELLPAAVRHSSDMSQRDYFEHVSPDGKGLTHRVNATNYNWKSVGENLAATTPDVVSTIEALLTSPKHCENMMDAKFRDVALACKYGGDSEYKTYWTMLFGKKIGD